MSKGGIIHFPDQVSHALAKHLERLRLRDVSESKWPQIIAGSFIRQLLHEHSIQSGLLLPLFNL